MAFFEKIDTSKFFVRNQYYICNIEFAILWNNRRRCEFLFGSREGISMKQPVLDVLSYEDMDKIHAATLQVLSEVGIAINHAEARALYKAAGCDVNDQTKVVKIPPELVNECIKKSPDHFTLYSRDGKHDVKMVSDGSVTNYTTFGIGVKCTHYLGPGKYEMRKSTLEDIGNIAKVFDACENVDEICQPVTALDYATADCSRTIREVDAVMSNTSKPFWQDTESDCLDIYADYETAVYGGDEEEARKKPFLMPCGCPSSPLQLDHAACEIYSKSQAYGMPVMILSMAMGAASSPIFLGGTLVTHNAEVLAGIVLAQIANPGCSVVYGSSTTSFDFFCDTAPVGSPELGLISAGVAQLAKYYKIPSTVAGI